MKLGIFDASVFLKFGTYQKETSVRENYGVPTGGIEALVNSIAVKKRDGYGILVCFDSQTTRTTTYEGYKGNRKPDPKVWIQAGIAYHFLTKAGIQCLKEDGVEADDLIIKAVKENKTPYNQITVFTNDMDLSQVVDKNVCIESPTVLAPNVNLQSYPYVVSKKFNVQYNTILLFKLLYGDSSDNMKAMSFKTQGLTNLAVYESMIEFGLKMTNNNSAQLCHPLIPVNWLKENRANLCEEDVQELVRRIKIFYPKKVSIDCKFNPPPLNKKALAELCALMNLQKAREVLDVPTMVLAKEQTDYMYQQKFEYVRYLECLEKGLPMSRPEVLATNMSVGSF